MSTPIGAVLIQDRISTDGGTNWKLIVCAQSSTLTQSLSTTEEKTRTCGTITATSVDAVKVSGTGLNVGDLAGTEVSYKDLQGYLHAQTVIKFERKNLVSGTVSESEVEYISFDGKVTSCVSNGPDSGSLSFDWEITSTGVIDLTP
jgi:hypothetical protein